LSGAGANQIGTGTKIAGISQQFTQGNITNTNNPLDTAISGQGFFRMLDANGNVLYSRNGQFQVDKNGFLVNNQGHKVSGYLPNAAGVIVAAAPVPLQINASSLKPSMTSNAVVGANLDSRSAVPLTSVFNSTDPTSYNNSSSLTVYDSLGGSHVGTMYFQRQPITPPTFVSATTTSATINSVTGLAVGNKITFALPAPAQTATITGIDPATNTVTFAALAVAPTGGPITTDAPSANWKTFLTVDGVAVAGAATPELATLTFDALGKLASTTPISTPVGKVSSAPLFPTSTTVSTTQTLTFDFGSPTAGTTQYGGNFGVNTLTQDGYTSGLLSSISTGTDGTILGHYSNGQSRAMGQVLLANFTNPQGLQPVGNNEWVETAGSGGPLVGTPGSSSLGLLQSSATEDSNVDLTAELVNMITAQRVYQANAQTIKTQDALLQTIVSLR
ncbi:MAG: hypothetical protein A3K00_08685, partial [Gallionellales bacterium RIFOXYD2_FULL_52_7]